MLPYDEYPEDRDFSDYNENVFGSQEQAEGVYAFLKDNWQGNEGGFDHNQIYDMIYEIDNYEEWEDEEGHMHYSFDYEWESPDGQYHGSGHAHG
jgi:hypothetical protein